MSSCTRLLGGEWKERVYRHRRGHRMAAEDVASADVAARRGEGEQSVTAS